VVVNGEEKTAAGGCMCGAVRYETIGEPVSVIHCHCESCRRHTGAAVATLAGLKKDRGTLDDPSVFSPQCHIHHDERVEWFDVADDLPRHHEWDDGEPYRHRPG
jgi:hypothetical protein